METSPVALAHNHARSALIETRRSNPVAASEEHDLAATEFATAAQNTTNTEAQRVLLLLEQHHKKLGQILKSRHENAVHGSQPAESANTSSHITSKTVGAVTAPMRAASPEPNPAIPKLSQNFKSPHREGPNSIASNLASARGIPGSQTRRGSPASPTLSAQHAGGKMTSGTAILKATDEPSRQPSAAINSTGREKHPKSRPTFSEQTRAIASSTVGKGQDIQRSSASSDAPFQQFYNTFESLISKLSAPLAFAGLPLTSTPVSAPAQIESASTAKSKSQVEKQAEPPPGGDVDYSQLISRAALRAVRDGVAQPSVAESFYVVPTTGGTVSYAGILNREHREISRHQRHLSNISEDTDDFVDARETIPSSPELTRLDAPSAPASLRGRRSRQSTGGSDTSRNGTTGSKLPPALSNKTMEELALENQALKHLSDTLSKRLHMWEVNAQSSSAALQQSLRSLQNYPRASSPASTTHSDGAKGHITTTNVKPPSQLEGKDDIQQRVDELEDLVRKLERERGKQDKENEKLKNVVGRYRERWEKLKEGAKSRREGGGTSNTNDGKEGKDGGTPKEEMV